MKIRIIHWSDFNCPYSYIGLKRLSDAADELHIDPEWEMKSFELPLNLKINENIREIAEKDSLTVNTISPSSSRNAHRLEKFVRKNHPELSQELVFEIFEANFAKNKDISDIETLSDIASSIGLDKSKTKEMLSGNSYDFEVELDTQDALFNGITSTPHYIIHADGQQLIVPGAFEKEDFKIALEDLASGEIAKKSFL